MLQCVLSGNPVTSTRKFVVPVGEASWLLLTVSGCYWLLLAVTGCYWGVTQVVQAGKFVNLPTAVCHPTLLLELGSAGAVAGSRGFVAQPLALARAALSSGLLRTALPLAAPGGIGLPDEATAVPGGRPSAEAIGELELPVWACAPASALPVWATRLAGLPDWATVVVELTAEVPLGEGPIVGLLNEPTSVAAV